MKICKMRNFNCWEIGLVKICLISLGILLGLYFYYILVLLLWLWWALFLVTALYFVVKFVRGK